MNRNHPGTVGSFSVKEHKVVVVGCCEAVGWKDKQLSIAGL